MLVDLLLIAAGIGVLAVAGDRLVDFAAALARRAHLTPAVVGLTVVSAGTSLPELFVSATAALEGSPAIAIGNVVGSNSANIGLVLGLAAVISPIPVAMAQMRFEYPFMLLASFGVFAMALDGELDRVEGVICVVVIIAFLVYSIHASRSRPDAGAPTSAGASQVRRSMGALLIGLLVSFVGLAVGARLLVDGAIGIAREFGVSERVIGLTIVAFGTSLPELVATGAAAVKHQHAMAIANIIGSNIFNLLMILGVTSLIVPIPVAPMLLRFDMPIMLGFSLLFLPLSMPRRRVSRRSGSVLLLLYVVYIGWLATAS